MVHSRGCSGRDTLVLFNSERSQQAGGQHKVGEDHLGQPGQVGRQVSNIKWKSRCLIRSNNDPVLQSLGLVKWADCLVLETK